MKKNKFYYNENKLHIKINDEIHDFEIKKIENVNIIINFNMFYNIFISLNLVVGVCLLILQEYDLFLFLFIVPFVLGYFYLKQKNIILKFNYDNESLEFSISECYFLELDYFIQHKNSFKAKVCEK